MLQRVALAPIVGLIIAWLGWSITRPDEDNWLYWLQVSDAGQNWRIVWGAIIFTILAAVLGSLALFLRRNPAAFLGMLALAVFIGSLVAHGAARAGEPLHPGLVWNLAFGMFVSFPLLFSDLVRGRQADVRDTKDPD